MIELHLVSSFIQSISKKKFSRRFFLLLILTLLFLVRVSFKKSLENDKKQIILCSFFFQPNLLLTLYTFSSVSPTFLSRPESSISHPIYCVKLKTL